MAEIKKVSEQAVNEIDDLKKAVYRFDIRINDLEQEIAQDTDEYNQLENEYSELISNGEDEKADKLFVKLDKLKGIRKAKMNRLDTMRATRTKIVIDNCNKVKEKTETLYLAFREEHQELYKEVVKITDELNQKRNELKKVNQAWEGQVHLNSRFIDHQVRTHSIHPTLANNNFAIPYMSKPFELK